MSDKRAMLRHFLATLAYRGNNILADVPENVASFRANDRVRTPLEILNHINGVLKYAHAHIVQYDSTRPGITEWDLEVECFFTILGRLDISLRDDLDLKDVNEEQLLQGPLADSMLHLGQIGILRRIAGSPVAAENYLHAKIEIGNTGRRPPVS